MNTAETFLIALGLILAVPHAVWRLMGAERFAPLVVVQIVTGVVLGPGVLGAAVPAYYKFVFTPQVVTSLNGVASWAVMMFVWAAGLELDLKAAWRRRGETGVTAMLALFVPLVFGAVVAMALSHQAGWIGSHGRPWQFVLGVGMACSVTALPILVLFMEDLGILSRPLGQRILGYASLDDIAVWAVLALILLDWTRIGRQFAFLAAFLVAAAAFRRLTPRLSERDLWAAGLLWLVVCGLAADASGLHFMVGAFLAGAALEAEPFGRERLARFRQMLLLTVMPVFFLSTGLRTSFAFGGAAVFAAAGALLVATVGGKLAGVGLAGRLLGWRRGEAGVIGWLLQTKALIMIIFVTVLLDHGVISSTSFTSLLLMAVGSTLLTIPFVGPALKRLAAEGSTSVSPAPELKPISAAA